MSLSILFSLIFAFVALATAEAASDCAMLPVDAEFWSFASSASSRSLYNNVEGALVMAFEATSEELSTPFTTTFASAQDLTQHALLSFNLFKVGQPSQVFVSVRTPHGTYRTPRANLFEQKNTITVDLASSEFASTDDVDAAFDEPIIGLSAVQAISLHLVSGELGHAQATVDTPMLCAPTEAVHDELRFGAANDADADATPLAFPDIASLSEALTTALSEVQRLSADIDALRATQRRASRAFDEFSVTARASLDNAVEALSDAMSANVEQTLANANLLQRVRARLAAEAEAHDARLTHLGAQFESLKSLALRGGETLDAAVARTNAEEAEAEAQELHKRSIDVAEQRAAAAAAAMSPRRAATAPTVADAFGRNVVTRAAKKSSPLPLVKAP